MTEAQLVAELARDLWWQNFFGVVTITGVAMLFTVRIYFAVKGHRATNPARER